METASPRNRLASWVSQDTTGGALILSAALAGFIWANTPFRDSYHALSAWTFGPESLGLHLPLSHWVADGLLALFFFVVGIELKAEFTTGNLSNIRAAALPVIAAVGGVAAPALIYSSVILASGDRSALHGWAIPSATDIAFSLAVLALFGKGIPTAVRAFLLTLAVADDLGGILIIAIFYAGELNFLWLAASLACAAVFAFLVRQRKSFWWLLIPLGLATWVLLHNSGVHATIAGVILGLSMPVLPMFDEQRARGFAVLEKLNPWTAGIVVPLFAFFSAGVTLVGGGGAGSVFTDPVFIAIVSALVIGKFVGVMGTTAVMIRLTPLQLPDSVSLKDIIPVGFLAGIGFTVSMLIAQLSFSDDTHTAAAKFGILIGSLLAAALAAFALKTAQKSARVIPIAV